MKNHYNDYWVWLLLLFSLTIPTSSIAHESWIEPSDFTLSEGDILSAHIRVGKMMRGNGNVYNPELFELLDIINGNTRTKVKGRLGDFPAIRLELLESGLTTLIYQSTGRVIDYETAEKFAKFARKEGVGWILDEHKNRGYPAEGFSETYFRYAKSLIAVDDAIGGDRAIGLPFEIIALKNPYTNGSEFVEVQVLWQGEPYQDAQISIFRKPSGGEVVRELVRTDSEGKVIIPSYAGQRYLLNSVYMVAQDINKDGRPWHSHWASMTYQIPP